MATTDFVSRFAMLKNITIPNKKQRSGQRFFNTTLLDISREKNKSIWKSKREKRCEL